MAATPVDPISRAEESLVILDALRRPDALSDPAEAAALMAATDALTEPEARWALRCFAVADTAGWEHVEAILRRPRGESR